VSPPVPMIDSPPIIACVVPLPPNRAVLSDAGLLPMPRVLRALPCRSPGPAGRTGWDVCQGCQALLRIRFILVPQTGQVPLAMRRPLVSVTSPSKSRFSLHFTQYPL